MREVSKEKYDAFYEEHLEILDRSPKFNPKDCSVNYKYLDKTPACKWVEYSYGKVKYFIKE